MEYTYRSYKNLMLKLKDNGYSPIKFCDVSDSVKFPAIIRHDVDMDLTRALEMAKFENEIGIKSTYFVLLSSEYYNLFSGKNLIAARQILDLGHEIGLHFDVTTLPEDATLKDIENGILKEKKLIEQGLDILLKSISWHIPRKDLLGVHLNFLDDLKIWNAYDPYFYSGYKYVSDSMMRWREPIEDYIEKKEYEKLQILTHPIWYKDEQKQTDVEILTESRTKKIDILDHYLDTIKPGYYSIITNGNGE